MLLLLPSLESRYSWQEFEVKEENRKKRVKAENMMLLPNDLQSKSRNEMEKELKETRETEQLILQLEMNSDSLYFEE